MKVRPVNDTGNEYYFTSSKRFQTSLLRLRIKLIICIVIRQNTGQTFTSTLLFFNALS